MKELADVVRIHAVQSVFLLLHVSDFIVIVLAPIQEERRAQLPRYQRLIPRPGQTAAAAASAPPSGAVGGMIPAQQVIPPQQPGMRHPIHGKIVSVDIIISVQV